MGVQVAVIPERFVATGTDSAVSITRVATMHRIGMRLDFAQHLDSERLARAVRLSLDAEPILGCSFRTDAFRAYWLRIPELDAARSFSRAEVADRTRAVNTFQSEEVDDAGPQVAVGLFTGSEGDTLGIKVSHIVADGQAAKQYAYLLADIYTRLGADSGYMPQPNLRTRPTGRDVWANLTARQRRDARKAKSWVNPTWEIPEKGSSGGELTYLTMNLPSERLARLKSYGKDRGATVNDMMLAAVFRACVREFDPPTGTLLSLMCTADLRRYLTDPLGLPISNVSISGSLDIERVDGETFEETLRRVRRSMEAWARTCYGAYPALNAERATVLGYRATRAAMNRLFNMAGGSGKTYPWFTNIGVIDNTRLVFDAQTPLAGHMFGPSAVGASIVPVVSTCRDTLTVCNGFCEQDFDPAIVARVLRGIETEVESAIC